MTITVRRVVISAIALILLAALLLVTPPPGGLWVRTLYDATHVPIFGVIAIGILHMTPTAWRIRSRFVVSISLVVLLGALSEIAQIPTARSASLGDLASDFLGGIGFLCIALGVGYGVPAARVYRWYLVPIGLVALAVPLAPLAYVSAGYVERARAVPGLIRFDSRYAELFFRVRSAELTTMPDPNSGRVSARIVFGDGRWPGITLNDIWPDWTAYDALEIDIENPGSTNLPMTLRIDDWDHRKNQSVDDRFNRRVTLVPERQTLRIPIDDIREAPAGRSMNMSRIDRLILFAGRKQAGRVVVVHDLRLVSEDDPFP